MSEADSDRGALVALAGRVVTDYEVWPGGIVLLEGGAIRDVSPDNSLLGEADEVHEHWALCSCLASLTYR